MAKQVLKSAINAYQILKPIGATGQFKMYLCQKEEGKTYVLKIAVSVESNPLLDREAFILNKMRCEAAQLEEEYAKIKRKPEEMLNYQLCFPDLAESFIASGQGNRRVNILGFLAIDEISNLVPVKHLASRDRVRVDRKTSAWMMGKFLKILVFAHSQDIAVGRVSGDNILIERNEHYVLVFDWTSAIICQDGVSEDTAREEISQGAVAMINALGGDPSTGKFPDDDQDADDRYAHHLYALACGNENDAHRAHARFYSLVRSLWPREYWPFTSYSL